MSDLLKLMQTIQSSSRISAVVVVSEGCDIVDGKLYTETVDIVEQAAIPVNVFKLCYPSVTHIFPRPLTQAVYFFGPGRDEPLFVRTFYDPKQNLKKDVEIASKMISGSTYEDASYDEITKGEVKQVEVMLATEDVSHFPSTFQRVRNFAKEMWTMSKESVHGRPMLTTSEDAHSRMAICQACPLLTANNVCTKCGCLMQVKTHVKTSRCPEGKW